MTTKTCGCTTGTCGCCQGTQPITPVDETNRPGLSAIRYRVGTQAAFLETMKARLASMTVDVPGADAKTIQTYAPLLGLTTRNTDDAAIALLDGWATVADVLTFYQERIANEGYLRTALQRRSVLELGRLVGYTLRPGVSASVYLAFTLDPNQTNPVDIPAGTAAQSVPGPNELPQTFETSAELTTQMAWNDLEPRMTHPQRITAATKTVYFKGTTTNLKANDVLLFEGPGLHQVRYVATVSPDFANSLTRVTLQDTVSAAGGAAVSAPLQPDTTKSGLNAFGELNALVKPLTLAPSLQPRGPAFLPRTLADCFDPGKDTLPQVLSVLNPGAASTLYSAWANLPPSAAQAVQIFAFRVKAAPFGSTAPLRAVKDPTTGLVTGTVEWQISGTVALRVEFLARGNSSVGVERDGKLQQAKVELSATAPPQTFPLGRDSVTVTVRITPPGTVFYTFDFGPLGQIVVSSDTQGFASVTVDQDTAPPLPAAGQTTKHTTDRYDLTMSSGADNQLKVVVSLLPPGPREVMFLDTQYDSILPQTPAVIVRPDPRDPGNSAATVTYVREITAVRAISKADYGITGKSTQLNLRGPWLTAFDTDLSVLRGTTVYAQAEALAPADAPCQADVQGGQIELGQLYDGLKSGRWIIVSGERTDIKDANGVVVTGVNASELIMVSSVKQGPNNKLPGDAIHSTLVLATPGLAYHYKRATVTIYGNVAPATDGGTKKETLGGGDGTQTFQTFTLKQPPLTFVSAPTPAGVVSTLQVFVNNLQWQETDTLAGLAPTDRNFMTQIDDGGTPSVSFGDGVQGARLPTGTGNVQAVYRSGIGESGNVLAGQISSLVSSPLGVKSVINPLPATGGADPEDAAQAQGNVPLAVMALDRLVSVQDYADFSRTFAGIGKANAQRLSDGHREVVHVTIAGANDIPIDKTSDLYKNLVAALHQFGDPDLPIQVDPRELVVLAISARVRLAADYQWDSVAAAVRAALVSYFGFQNRALGQSACLCEAISLIQNVPGVAYVDVDDFRGLSESTITRLGNAAAATGQTDGSAQGQDLEVISPRVAGPSDVVAQLARLAGGQLQPAQLVILSDAVQDTVVLNQI